MCGIIALVGRPPSREAPSTADLAAIADAALGARPDLAAVTAELARLDAALAGVPGLLAVAADRALPAVLTARLDQLDAFAADVEAGLDDLDADALESASAALIGLRDVLWAVRRDRLHTYASVLELAGREASPPALAGYLLVQHAFNAIDRLEVRGRDSAGIHLYVWGHGLSTGDPAVRALLASRSTDPLFQSGSVRATGECLSFVYKAAAEIGELGDNVKAMRAAVLADDLLRLALSAPTARLAVLGHTRWASVGIISEPNAHPVNSEEVEQRAGSNYVVAALNGDVDNHADLKAAAQLEIAAPITTDAKVIPSLVARQLDGGAPLVEAFRRTVAEFEGSVAIAAASATAPNTVLLGQRGSGQALYVGLSEDCFVAASEPYGVVELTPNYVRMDGETPSDPQQPSSRGQVFVLDGDLAGELAGITRLGYDGTPLPFDPREVVRSEVTTRDIDRGEAAHYLLKEITEAPESLRKTVRGKIAERDGLLRALLGERTLPPALADRLADGSIKRVRVVGQGTAAVAGRSMAAVLGELVDGQLTVDAITATELSGFGLRLDMRDTLIVAVSQSGTTTDTNRTVDLARGRGAAVIGIVNRRGSDLTDKSDGVLYTSDGRDVEMSVASTKAFYAQVAAGVLLACAIAEAAGAGSAQRRHALLTSLRELPSALHSMVARRPEIAEAARRFAPQKRYWAVVGSGANAVAAAEVRIKLSELCYKSIACDITEDKKHIDLSSEPLILVCAAGLVGGTASDVAKEIAIYKAHKATAIVVATEGEERFGAAAQVIPVPSVDPSLAFVLSAMAGHLFGYEAALAIDALAHPLRELRSGIDDAVGAGAEGIDALREVRAASRSGADAFHDGLRAGSYNGHLEASTAVRLSVLLRDLASDQALDDYQAWTGKIGTPAAFLDDLTSALTAAIDELTRPIDAIKHQAKTVTVGISRSDEGVLDRRLVQEVLAAGPGRDLLTYKTLKVLADLDPAVEAVTGFIRYRIEGNDDRATISIVDRGGLARDVPSRVETNPELVGTKRRVAAMREVLVARGRRDGRTVIFVPEVKSGVTVGITLLHVRFHDRLPAPVMRGVLQGYDHRYDRLVDWVSETEGSLREDLLGEIPVADLLILPLVDIADRWLA
jgi:glucosamine--fructose-6-phosphate aminotransferase (isomerizing)